MVIRGGRASQDLLVTYSNAQNCSGFCLYLANGGFHDEGSLSESTARYSKCSDAVSYSVLNRIRAAFPSQIGTTGMDDTVPQFNYSTCLRMNYEF